MIFARASYPRIHRALSGMAAFSRTDVSAGRCHTVGGNAPGIHRRPHARSTRTGAGDFRGRLCRPQELAAVRSGLGLCGPAHHPHSLWRGHWSLRPCPGAVLAEWAAGSSEPSTSRSRTAASALPTEHFRACGMRRRALPRGMESGHGRSLVRHPRLFPTAPLDGPAWLSVRAQAAEAVWPRFSGCHQRAVAPTSNHSA